MKIVIIISFCFFFGFNFSVEAQEYDSLYKELENSIRINKTDDVIKIIDSLVLTTNISKKELNNFRALKVEALVEQSNLTDALKLSDKILYEPKYVSAKGEVHLRVWRALIFEFFNEKQAGLIEFEKLENIYKTRPKDKYYGQYLYRKSSFYKVVKPVINNDSIALDLARKATVFGDKNKYGNVSGTGRLIQSFYIKNNYEEKNTLLLQALNDFKSMNSVHDVCMINLNLAQLYINNRNYSTAKRYIDSTIYLASKSKKFYLRSISYEYKSLIFERENNIDSAFFYYKKFHDANMDIKLKQQDAELIQINNKNKIEIQKIQAESNTIRLSAVEKNNSELLFYMGGIILLLIVIILLYIRLNHKNKKIDDQNSKLKLGITEKEILLKELNHRVKNNLSLIISLIKFQSQEVEDNFYKEKFNHLEKRINTIAIAHEQFVYSDNRLEGEFYNLEEYLQKISDSLINTSPKNIYYVQNISKMQLTIDTALPIGILMNELISNSMEHAIVKNDLRITTEIKIVGNWIQIFYSDNGSSFNVDENRESLGLFIIESMVTQLKGTCKRKGASYTIKLKMKNSK